MTIDRSPFEGQTNLWGRGTCPKCKTKHEGELSSIGRFQCSHCGVFFVPEYAEDREVIAARANPAAPPMPRAKSPDRHGQGKCPVCGLERRGLLDPSGLFACYSCATRFAPDVVETVEELRLKKRAAETQHLRDLASTQRHAATIDRLAERVAAGKDAAPKNVLDVRAIYAARNEGNK